MHIRHVLALIALASLDACLAPAESSPSDTPTTEEPTGEAEQAFDASQFRFTTWVKDDGQGSGGGSQRATAPLSFVDTRTSILGHTWVCIVSVQLPIRSSYVTISPETAAEMTAEVANVASSIVMHSEPSWPVVGLFCRRLAAKMQDIFATVPGGPTGARVISK